MGSDGETTRSRPLDGWKGRIAYPTLLAGVVGGGIGLLSKRPAVQGTANLAATYATNLAIVAGCYCGTRELVRDARKSEPDDLLNSVVGGILSGALLGRIQGGPTGAVKYAVIFAATGTALDFATLKLSPHLQRIWNTSPAANSQTEGKNSSWWRLPDWSPIQVLDDEALAAKQAREQQLYAQRGLGHLNKEKS